MPTEGLPPTEGERVTAHAPKIRRHPVTYTDDTWRAMLADRGGVSRASPAA
jgi:hypothetical protein